MSQTPPTDLKYLIESVGDEFIVSERTCIEGPLEGVTLCGRHDDHRPIWYVPMKNHIYRSYALRRAARMEELDPAVQKRTTGCYVQSPINPHELIFLERPKDV